MASGRVGPYGLIHGPVTYLLGKRPDRDDPPVYYRLDRMNQVRAIDVRGHPPEDWDLNAWLAESFGIWREEVHDITLRVSPSAVERARAWRFHPHQRVEEAGDELIIRFRSGGLLELVNHLFGWAGDLVIEGPTALQEMMKERLRAHDSITHMFAMSGSGSGRIYLPLHHHKHYLPLLGQFWAHARRNTNRLKLPHRARVGWIQTGRSRSATFLSR